MKNSAWNERRLGSAAMCLAALSASLVCGVAQPAKTVALTGRIVKDGKPVGGVRVGVFLDRGSLAEHKTRANGRAFGENG